MADGVPHDGGYSRYEWIVDVTRPWQRWFAPLLRPVFAWSHNVVMGWGEAGLKRKLRRG